MCKLKQSSTADPVPQIFADIPLKPLPFTDSTNFDNFELTNPIPRNVMEKLQLRKILDRKDLNDVQCQLRYRTDFFKKLNSIVFTVQESKTERRTFLANYAADAKLIDWKLIAYDEIAESCSRVESDLSAKNIIVHDWYFCDEGGERLETRKFKVLESGEIRVVN